MSETINNPPYWRYFQALEGDLESCFDYVEPVDAHLDVYSDRFSRIIVLACTEIENALKAWAVQVGDPRPHNIDAMKTFVLRQSAAFTTAEVGFLRHELTFQPWGSWPASNPAWWKEGYNAIKHDRLGSPAAATLRNAASSVGALLVVLLHLYRVKFGRDPMPFSLAPRVITLVEPDDGISGGGIIWTWELPGERLARRGTGSAGSL